MVSQVYRTMQGSGSERMRGIKNGSFMFDTNQRISFCCECGLIKGQVELMKWGIRVFFECTDCSTSFSMEVKE